MIPNLYTKAKLAYQRWQGRRGMQALVGFVIENTHDPAKIYDHVNYALPVLLPQSLREDLVRQGKLDEYITEAYSTAVRFQFDAPYKQDLPFTPVTEDPLCEWSWSTRKYVLEQCHAAYDRNPDAKVAINHIANFAVGEGFQLVTYHPDVEELLTDFIDDNNVREYERDASKDLMVDGELVVRYFYDSDLGKTTFLPLRPWELRSIKTELGNYRNIESFEFQLQQDQGDYSGGAVNTELIEIPADEIGFAAINKRSYELRGRSHIYAALPWLKARKDWLENRARINYWLSVILWHVSVDTNNSAALAAVRSRWATPPTPGSIAVEHSAVEVQAMQASPNAPEAADDGRQLLMQLAKNFGLPEYFLGDGENANLASASRQQLPALVAFEEYQWTLVTKVWNKMFRKVIQNAIDDGKLPTELQKHDGNGEPIAGEMIPTIKAFDVQYADITQENLMDLTSALEKQLQNDLVSRRQARSELNRDPDKTEKEIQEERERDMMDMAQGRLPMPPTMRPDALNGDEDEPETEQPEEPQAVPEPS